jgi:hypothetical protein
MRSAIAVSLLVLLAGARPAWGQSAHDAVAAEALFDEARALIAQKRYAEACPKLAESQRLDPAGGTLLNLADCHEHEGKTASAWTEFKDALYLSRDSRPDRVKIAEEHIKTLEAKLARLTLRVAPDARVSGLTLSVDGAPRQDAAWGSAIPIDPGEHRVTASAPGRAAWETKVTIADAEQRAIDVPKLAETAPPQATPVPNQGTPAAATPQGEAAKPVPPEPRKVPVAAYAVTGAGIVALGVGAVFGVRAITKNASNDACGPDTCTSSAGQEQNDDARHSALVADIAVGAGLVATGVGVWWILSSRASSPKSGQARTYVAPMAAPDRAGIQVGGTF